MDTLIRLTATYALFAIALVALLGWVRVDRATKPVYAVAGAVAVAVVAVAVKAAGLLWTDPRPFVVDHVAPLIAHPADNGFPSDHTALGTAVAAVVLCWHRRTGAALLAIAALLGAARVAAGVHHVPDVLAGYGVGLLAGGVGVLVARLLPLDRLPARLVGVPAPGRQPTG